MIISQGVATICIFATQSFFSQNGRFILHNQLHPAILHGVPHQGVVKFIRNDRGWEKMEADHEAQGKPFYGELEEELEKEKCGIDE